MQSRGAHGTGNDPAWLAERVRQAEQAAGRARSIEAIHAHAVMALHYRARLQKLR